MSDTVTLPPSDNPRRKQWECFFNGTQESLDYINRMTECCDEIYRQQRERFVNRVKNFMEEKARQKS